MLNILLQNTVDENEVWEVPADEIKWNEEVNTISSGSLSINFQALKALATKLGTSVSYIIKGGKRKIIVIDTSYPDDPILFIGWIRDYQISSTASETSTISLNFAGLGAMLTKRVGQNYAFYDQIPSGEIFNAELSAAQSQTNGDMGLSLETLSPTTTRQRTVKRTNLLDLLIGMSKAKTKDGFDFSVNKNGLISIAETNGLINGNIVFDERNSQQPQLAGKLTTNLANRVYVQGGELTDESGNVTQEAIQVVVENTESQAIWGLHEEYVSATDIATESFLIERGRQVLEDRAFPRNTESLSLQHLGDDPDWRSYKCGDWVKVVLPNFELNELLRVSKRSIQYTKGVYKIGLSLSREEVDA